MARVGKHVFYKKEIALDAALETIWQAKRAVKAETKLLVAESFRKWQERARAA